MDEQWGYVGAKSRQRWLFYAHDRLRKTVVAHVFGEHYGGDAGASYEPAAVTPLTW
ncbi:IS1 family transposase [Klebsiella pneumoniae]|uniref:IS1 family transposase n=1 Tax=Klebsiella pneumoniae TaxID=573 RepID=UPI00237A243E|nr:IS1 family transposase [Klebsiella pneumoniae]